MTTRLSTTSPTITPIATAPPVFSPPPDEPLAVTLLSVVDFGVGFCDGIAGKGAEEAGVVELLGGAGGDVGGDVEVDEGTEGGGGDTNVLSGGEDPEPDGEEGTAGDGEVFGGSAAGGGGEFDEGVIGTVAGGGGEG